MRLGISLTPYVADGGAPAPPEPPAPPASDWLTFDVKDTYGASSAFAGRPASNAFDGNAGTSWSSVNTTTPHYLYYSFHNPTVISKYRYTNNPADADVTSIELQGSNDGVNWTVLHAQAGITWAGGAETKEYSFANTTSYQVYRLKIVASNGGWGAAIALQFYGYYIQWPTGHDYIDVSGQTYASSSNWGGLPASNVFDSNFTTRWSSANGVVPHWVRIQFASAKTVSYYAIVTTAGGSVPTEFTLQGSNNGTDWSTLDSRTGIAWQFAKQTKTFAIASPAAYIYYRLNITASADGWGEAYEMRLVGI